MKAEREGNVAAIPNQQQMPSISMDGLVTIVGAVLLLLAIIYFNNDLHYRLDTKIDTVRTELKADIDSVRTELKADIVHLETNIDTVRTELKADIDAVRTELKADIDTVRTELKADIESVRSELSADIQRMDDRLFVIVSPPVPEEEADTP